MSTPPVTPIISGPLMGAVVPAPPIDYQQRYMGRLVDVINKIIEQLTRPQQVTGATLVLTDLPHETPRQNIEGEVYTKMCDNCGTGQVLLAIVQHLDETVVQRRSKRNAQNDAPDSKEAASGSVPDGRDSNPSS